MSVNALYELWLNKVEDAELLAELKDAEGNAEDINDRFFQTLAFGTGGLRGVIGAGTNRMNIYTVGLASQALAAWVQANGKSKSVAIGYDSRIKSDVFARTAAARSERAGSHESCEDEREFFHVGLPPVFVMF